MADTPLLTALYQGRDRADAVSVDGRACSYEELLAAAGAVARRAAGRPAFAVEATASLETVAAVVGGLLAGVPVVPVAPDAGPDERAHVLRDSGAEVLPVDFAERADFAQAPAGRDRAGAVHLGHDRAAQGRAALPGRHRRRPRRAGRRLAVDGGRHPGARAAAVPRARPGARACWARCAPAAGWCTPAARHRRRTRRPAAACTSGCRRCGTGWCATRPPRGRSPGRGCWCRAARRCPRRSSPACGS